MVSVIFILQGSLLTASQENESLAQLNLVSQGVKDFIPLYQSALLENEKFGFLAFCNKLNIYQVCSDLKKEKSDVYIYKLPEISQLNPFRYSVKFPEKMPLMLTYVSDQKILLEYNSQKVVWNVSGQTKQEIEAIVNWLNKASTVQETSFLNILNEVFGVSRAEADSLGIAIALALTVAVIAAGYYLVNKAGKNIDRVGSATTQQINRIGNTVNNNINQVGSNVNRAVNTVEDVVSEQSSNIGDLLDEGQSAISSASDQIAENINTLSENSNIGAEVDVNYESLSH